jgi:hypothetical protein
VRDQAPQGESQGAHSIAIPHRYPWRFTAEASKGRASRKSFFMNTIK